MKQLSIAVPSYNSEKFIDVGLNSYVYEDGTMDERLEVIIINDGSTDGTLKKANEWHDRFPDGVKVIDKENGGHGSGINAGIRQASGRYYKVIDSDDWIVTENLKSILDELSQTSADIVVTGFHTVNIASKVTLPYGTGDIDSPAEMEMAEFVKNKDKIIAAQMFHGLMYNAEFYRNAKIEMSEGVFFEDQEYAIIPFMYAKNVLVLPYFFYEYQTGSLNQSVTFESQGKREGHLLQVTKKIIAVKHSAELDAAQREFVDWRIANVATSYYATVLIKGGKIAGGREKAERFHEYLLQAEPEICAATEKKYNMMKRLSKVPKASALYGKLFNSKAYSSFKKRWIK